MTHVHTKVHELLHVASPPGVRRSSPSSSASPVPAHDRMRMVVDILYFLSRANCFFFLHLNFFNSVWKVSLLMCAYSCQAFDDVDFGHIVALKTQSMGHN